MNKAGSTPDEKIVPLLKKYFEKVYPEMDFEKSVCKRYEDGEMVLIFLKNNIEIKTKWRT